MAPEEPDSSTADTSAPTATSPAAGSYGVSIPGYFVERRLGQGGMGSVYLARDEALGRRVALKVVLEGRAGDAESRRRFRREARTMASVEHPNVVRLYSFGTTGASDYLVMEYVEGETLATRLARTGPLAEEEALRILRGMLEGLDAAWEKGIVHRDIKPSNVLLDVKGETRVADFGLAKAVVRSGDPSLTADQSVLGTPHYLSPEQAAGQPVDFRADIYSAGLVLYEMLTGERPFAGPTAAAVVARRLTESAPDLGAKRPGLSEQTQAVYRWMVGRWPEDRPRSYAEIIAAVRGEAVDAPSRGPAPSGGRRSADGQKDSATGASPWTAGRPWVWAALAGVLVLTAVLTWNRKGPHGEPGALGRSASTTSGSALRVEKLTSRGDVWSAAVSPDGRYVAYGAGSGARRGIWVRDVVEGTENRLGGSLAGGEPILAFSKDGRTIFMRAIPMSGQRESVLYRVPIIGGEPQLVRTGRLGDLSPDSSRFLLWQEGGLAVADVKGGEARNLGPGESAIWLPDSEHVLVARVEGQGHALFVVPADRSGERKVADVPEGHDIELVAMRPDGRLAACWLSRRGPPAQSMRRLWAVDLVDGSVRPIGDIAWSQVPTLLWLPDGGGFVAEEWVSPRSQLWYGTFPDGQVRRVPVDGAAYRSASLTADGSRLVAVQGIARFDVLVSRTGDRGPFSRVSSATEKIKGLCWTPDNQIILSSNEAGSYDLFTMGADGSGRKALTLDRSADEIDPAASPDGRHVVFVLDKAGERGLWRVNRDGSGLLRLTRSRDPDRGRDRTPRFTPDGHWVLFSRWLNGPSLWKIAVDGGEPVIVKGPASETPPAPGDRAYGASASPDGRLIAFFHSVLAVVGPRVGFSPQEVTISDTDGRTLRTLDLPALDGLLVADDLRVRWSGDGRAVYYQTIEPRQLWKRSIDGGQPRAITQLEPGDGLGAFDVSPDGTLFALVRESSVSDVVMIRNFR